MSTTFEYKSSDASQGSMQSCARAIGAAMLLSIVFGALGEAFIPGRIIVGSDAAATAANVLQHPDLFRAGYATYLVEGICDVALSVLWYLLLRPVSRSLALLSAFFGVVSMAGYAVAEAFYFAPSLILRDAPYLASFSKDQRNTAALLSFKLFSMIAALFLIHYGIASILRGYLIARSGYLPKALGWLLMFGGAGFCLQTVLYVLAPQYNSNFFLMPMAIAGIPLTGWLLIKGVDASRLPEVRD